MKRALFILLLVAIAGIVGYADPNANLTGSGDFSASAVLWFSGTDVTAQVSGTINLKGNLAIGDTVKAFNVQGPLSGRASGNSETLIGSGWATFTARGTLASGEPSGEAIVLHGAINLSTDDIDLSSDTAGSAKGSLYVVVTLPDQSLRMRGNVSGTASGGFVKPDDPHTMQLDGTGTFTFAVATRDATVESKSDQEDASASEVSWNTDGWPQEMRDQFIHMMEEESK